MGPAEGVSPDGAESGQAKQGVSINCSENQLPATPTDMKFSIAESEVVNCLEVYTRR